MALCPECGFEAAENAQFCPICGTPQTPAVDEPRSDETAAEEASLAPVEVREDSDNSIDSEKVADIEESSSNDVPIETPEPEISDKDEEESEPKATADAEGASDARPAEQIRIPISQPGETVSVGASGTDGRKPGLKPLSESTVLAGRYEIVRKIGGGGMGAVYLATDRNLGGVERAVKEMVQSSIEEEQQKKAIEDFRRESMILSTLDHPSIPTIYDYFFDDSEGRFYLVMKYISGGDLANRLRSTP